MANHTGMEMPALHEVEEDDRPLPWYKRPLPLWTQLLRFIPFLLLTVLILGAAIVVTNARMPDPKEVRPLPDFMLEWIPLCRALESVTDIIIFLLNATTVVVAFKVFLLERHVHGLPLFTFLECIPKVGRFLNRVVFGVIDSGRRPHPLRGVYKIMAIRFLTSYAVVMFFRAFVITATSYPATDNHCQHPQVIEHPVLNVILTLVTLGSGAIHCGDLMFSGHTMILCVSFMLVWEYSPYLHPWALRVWAGVLLPFSFYCILASRSHYTDDILVAAYCMIATYKIIDHRETGAPWQLQLFIRWLPWPGSNTWKDEWPVFPRGAVQDVVIVEHHEGSAESPLGKASIGDGERDEAVEEEAAAVASPQERARRTSFLGGAMPSAGEPVSKKTT
jgi:shingomyelin synthase